MTDLASALGCQTVAEGIEDQDQLKNLRQTSCNVVQGFIFFRPMPVEAFEEQADSERGNGSKPEAQAD